MPPSCIFRPPSANAEYYNGMLDIIEGASNDDKEITILGDINYNYKIDESLSSNLIN